MLVHLSRNNADVAMFAPDMDQMHVINHTKGEPMEPNRFGFCLFVCYLNGNYPVIIFHAYIFLFLYHMDLSFYVMCHAYPGQPAVLLGKKL